MSKVTVVTDSTADFPAGLIEQLGIKVVPLTVNFGKEEFIDKVNLTNKEFYAKLRTCSEETFPRTSQPAPDPFFKAYKESGENIISIHVPEKLSGTCNSAKRAKEALPNDFDVRIIDSQTLSLGLGFLAIEAAKMAKDGSDLDAIEQEVMRLIPKIRLYAMLDTLKYLEKGGRIGSAQRWLGALLDFKPIIKIQDGEVVPVSRPRSTKKAIPELLEKFLAEGKMVKVGVLYAEAEPEALEVSKMLKEHYPGDIPVAEIGSVLGTHAGPGAIGICGLLK